MEMKPALARGRHRLRDEVLAPGDPKRVSGRTVPIDFVIAVVVVNRCVGRLSSPKREVSIRRVYGELEKCDGCEGKYS